MGHLKELSAMYAQQHRHGKLFVHSAELEATTWQAKCMRELLTLQDVEMVQRGDAAWLTNSRAIAQQLINTGQLETAVAAGMRAELIRVGRLDALGAGGPTIEEPVPEDEWKVYWDEVSGAKLDGQAVRAARDLEVEYMHRLRIYEQAIREEAKVTIAWLSLHVGWTPTKGTTRGSRSDHDSWLRRREGAAA